MKLLVKHDYRSNQGGYQKGEEIDVPDAFGAWLQRDAVGCFEEIKPERPKRTLRKPPADKALSDDDVVEK